MTCAQSNAVGTRARVQSIATRDVLARQGNRDITAQAGWIGDETPADHQGTTGTKTTNNSGGSECRPVSRVLSLRERNG